MNENLPKYKNIMMQRTSGENHFQSDVVYSRQRLLGPSNEVNKVNTPIRLIRRTLVGARLL